MSRPRTSTGISKVKEQHSVVRTVVLHLLPGVLATLFYLAAAPLVRSLGFPSMMAFFVAILLVIIPFELGYPLYWARKNGSSLESVILYREPVSRLQFVALVLSLLAWSGIFYVLIYPPLDTFFIDNVFWWLPESFFFAEDFARYSTTVLLITWTFGMVVNAIVGPIVEEVYFRGYLLPRISRLGAWAPLVNTVLFSLYHFWTPWQNMGRIVEFLPIVYVAWYKKSIYVSMGAHVLGNVSTIVILLPVLLGG
jgi:membrane protease YdiL (CAAX protease family)